MFLDKKQSRLLCEHTDVTFGVQEEERLCDLYNVNVENKFQFVFYCPVYQELHHRLFESWKTIDVMLMNDDSFITDYTSYLGGGVGYISTIGSTIMSYLSTRDIHSVILLESHLDLCLNLLWTTGSE